MGIEGEKRMPLSREYRQVMRRNPDLRAFRTDLKTGKFDAVEPNTWVVYHEGQLAGSGLDRDQLLEPFGGQTSEGPFCTQVNVTQPDVAEVLTPFSD